MMACQVGPFMVAPSPSAKVSHSRVQGPVDPVSVITPEHGSGGQHQALRYQQQLAAIEQIARGAGRNGQQKDRKIGGGLHQRHQQSRRRQFGHQPGRADVLHPGADVRHHRCDPQPAEPGVKKRGPGAAARRGGGRGQASILEFFLGRRCFCTFPSALRGSLSTRMKERGTLNDASFSTADGFEIAAGSMARVATT